MKTYQAWEDAPEMAFDEFVQPCDEVDEEMYMHFLEVVVPHVHYRKVYQSGEVERVEKGRYFYMTFSQVGERYFYLGVLPAMKQPKAF